MSKFGVGDKVKRTGSNIYNVVKGEIYKVTGASADGTIWIDNLNDGGYLADHFELVDPNAMPKLEAGMIVELKSMMSSDKTFLALYVTEKEWYRVFDSDCGNPVAPKPASEILAIYKNHGPLYRKSNACIVVWERTPEKTETQLKIEDLRATIDGAVEKLSELEAIEASRN